LVTYEKLLEPLMVESFGERLATRVRDRGALCAGIDPSRETIHSWQRDDVIEGLEFFSLSMVEAVAQVAVAVKLQVSFYERFGSAGFRVLERVISDARDAELLVIADAKRGDIGSTNDGYAQAWLNPSSPLAVDAVTASPFLGVDALEPLFREARAHGAGVFVLAATSNPEGRLVQTARTADGVTVERAVLESLRERNHEHAGRGSFGAVVGATRNAPDFELSSLNGPYLVPGVGAQGADARDVARLFERCAPGSVLPTISRGLSSVGPERRAIRDVAARWQNNFLDVLNTF
jgi:orotidine-5'-phosphate decarboxylase